MVVQISGKHIDVGQSLSAHIEQGIEKVATRYFDGMSDAQVTLDKETHSFFCDITLHVSKNFVVRAKASDSDAYKAFDLASEKLEKRVGRYKSRLRDRKRHGDEDTMPALRYVVNGNDDDAGEDTPLIIAEMNSEVPTLTVGEAVMRMDLSDYPVLMFKNGKHGNLNVVYKRPDGHIGWIDPTIKG